MEELEQLILAAKKNLPSDYVQLTCNSTGWHLSRMGSYWDDPHGVTFAKAMATLREWARPKSVTITVPMKDALAAVDGNFRPNNMAYPVIELLKAAIKGA